MISGATNKNSLYSQPRHFANGFRPGWPACLAPSCACASRRAPFEKVPTIGNHFAFRADSRRPSVAFLQVATAVHKRKFPGSRDRGNFSEVTGSRAVAFT